MSPLFQRKKEEESTRKCNCEICRFSDEIDRRIGAEFHEVLSPFIWLPSTIRKINPEESLKKARECERTGNLNTAITNYSEAFIVALATEGADIKKYGKACIDFYEKHQGLSTAYAGLESYRKLLNAPDVAKKLGKTYIDFIGSIPEPVKK